MRDTCGTLCIVSGGRYLNFFYCLTQVVSAKINHDKKKFDMYQSMNDTVQSSSADQQPFIDARKVEIGFNRQNGLRYKRLCRIIFTYTYVVINITRTFNIYIHIPIHRSL